MCGEQSSTRQPGPESRIPFSTSKSSISLLAFQSFGCSLLFSSLFPLCCGSSLHCVSNTLEYIFPIATRAHLVRVSACSAKQFSRRTSGPEAANEFFVKHALFVRCGPSQVLVVTQCETSMNSNSLEYHGTTERQSVSPSVCLSVCPSVSQSVSQSVTHSNGNKRARWQSERTRERMDRTSERASKQPTARRAWQRCYSLKRSKKLCIVMYDRPTTCSFITI